MKNKIIIFSTIFLILMVFQSCQKDRLDLLPEQSIDSSLAFSSVSAARAALNGVYSQAQFIEVFGSQPSIIQDYMADNTKFVGSFPTLQEISDFITTTPNVSVREIWAIHYRVINSANLVIDNVPNIVDPAFNDDVANELIGQAKFIRAITYMQLVNLFAHPYNLNNGTSLGVPLVTKGFTGEIEYPARATVNEVHVQIKADLEDAITRLENFGNDATKASKEAAAAYLSRLHLYRGEYTEASSFADMVISSNIYSANNDFSFYGNRTPEWIFVIANSEVDNGATGAGGWGSYHRPANQGGRGDCPMSESLSSAFLEEAGDLRYSVLTDSVVSADQVKRRMTLKFADAQTDSDDAPMMRISEVMLTRAEALARTNGSASTIISLVNPIRVRAGLAAWTEGSFSTPQEWVDAILNERRKELCFEGHRRMDLLRVGTPLRENNPDAVLGASRTVLPVPQREIDINSNLVQNPGY